MSGEKRLIIVANRLPYKTVRLGEDSWSLKPSAGGLVSALTGLINVLWIGCSDICIDDNVGQKSLTRVLQDKRIIPVFLDAEMIREYYDGYCNRFLWYKLHNLNLPQEMTVEDGGRIDSQFNFYEKVNKLVFDTVKQHCKEGDVIWCQNYHLMFLPQYLKNLNKNIKIGWFLHTPFPSYDVFTTLPSRSQLLRGILGADVIGFHTSEYKTNFINACTHILNFESTNNGVRDDQGRLICVIASPIGINPSRFIQVPESPAFQLYYNRLFENLSSVVKVIVAIDRLDPIKGLVNKLLAYELFLKENPCWHNKVMLYQLIIPSRTQVPEYQELLSKIFEIKGRIDSVYQRMATWNPIIVRYNNLEFNRMCAQLVRADIGLITSIKDGFNLVSYEFVACQAIKKDNNKGVLIISEFAGSSKTLDGGAIRTHPLSINDMASAIAEALTLTPEKRLDMFRICYERVSTQTTDSWAHGFLSYLGINCMSEVPDPEIREV